MWCMRYEVERVLPLKFNFLSRTSNFAKCVSFLPNFDDSLLVMSCTELLYLLYLFALIMFSNSLSF